MKNTWIKFQSLYVKHQQVARILVISCLILLLVIVGISKKSANHFDKQLKDEKSNLISDAATSNYSERGTTKVQAATKPALESSIKYAEIKGSVKQPNVYQFKSNERVVDLIKKAGGLSSDANDRQLNLAEELRDGMCIYVPSKDDDTMSTLGVNQTNTTSNIQHLDDGAPINLNQADLAELQQIGGIGPKKAADIISYREQNGSFKSVEQLLEVSGIGEKTFAGIKESICVD